MSSFGCDISLINGNQRIVHLVHIQIFDQTVADKIVKIPQAIRQLLKTILDTNTRLFDNLPKRK